MTLVAASTAPIDEGGRPQVLGTRTARAVRFGKTPGMTRRPVLVPAVLSLLLASALVSAGPGARADALDSEAGWSWPTGSPVAVSRPFDPPARPWLPGHRGVDLDLPVGAIVRAPAPGRILVAGGIAGRPLVSIVHGGIRSTFEPVEPLVAPGALVARGQAIGVLLAGHSPSGLHWGAKLSADSYVDPLRMLVPGVALEPWEGRD